jgi:molecular chaperone Hsp33
MTRNSDAVQRFQLADADVRGELVCLDHSLHTVLAQHFYPAPVARLLGEALAASVLLSSTLKFSGTLSLQSKSSGPLGILFAESSHDRRIRGYARVAEGAVTDGIGNLLANGTLAITIAPEAGERYQGIVPLDGDTLGACIEHYFAQSEQIPTLVCLACDGERAAGLLLQALPRAAAPNAKPGAAWEHFQHLARTLQSDELLQLPFETILFRLFHQDGVYVQPTTPVVFGCRCSLERAGNTLRTIGEREARSVLAEQGAVTIHCEFCQQEYRFDGNAVNRLFSGADSKTLH